MEKDYYQFIRKVKEEYNFDLENYKDAQMYRRLKTLCEKKGCKDFLEYFQLIKEDKKEKEEFFDKITINVTEFFRNRERWEELMEMVKHKKELKVTSAACSTGEEVYTVKILTEEMNIRARVIGIDMDKNSLKKAKEGIYNELSLKDAKKEEIEKYFEEIEINKYNYVDKGYKVKENLKVGVRFEEKDLFEGELEGENDIVICRNVMIYFKEEAKEGLYNKINKALKKDGILFVGSSEQIFKPEKYGFEMIKPFFYKKV